MLTVREAIDKDIDLIVAYWTESEPGFLIDMGVDLAKLPTQEQFTQMLTHQWSLPLHEKQAYALIWYEDDMPIGHCNVNSINYGKSAYMHLHLWKSGSRRRGVGTELVQKSIRMFFEKLELDTLYCQPKTDNIAPNKTLAKLGFEFMKTHTTVPGSINYEQEVNLWQLTKKVAKENFV